MLGLCPRPQNVKNVGAVGPKNGRKPPNLKL